MSKEMTICAKCKFHRNAHDGAATGPPRDTWFYQQCTHPKHKRAKAIDPVTGVSGFCYADTITDTPYPYCRDLNRGECEEWQAR